MTSRKLDDALLRDRDGFADLFPALGCSLFLEPFVVEDTERLEAAVEIVRSWLGDRFRWSLLTAFGYTSPYRALDLEYVERLASLQAREDLRELGGEPWRRHLHTRGDFALVCGAGEEESEASPYQFFVYTEVVKRLQQIVPMWQLTVPTSYPVAEFQAKVDALASILRVRWGSAGYTYSAWPGGDTNPTRKAMYKHSKRFLGFDVPIDGAFFDEWYEHIRSVNWLTYLGADFAKRAQSGLKMLAANSTEVKVDALENGVTRIVAGAAPSQGDANRMDIPRSYTVVDTALRGVRRDTALNFCDPWSERTSLQWLRRFQRQLP